MSSLPSRIYAVVDHPRWVERLGGAGLRFIELYLRDMPEEDIRAQAQLAQELATRCNVSLALNRYWQIAIELGYEWVHLGPEDLETADLDAIRTAGLRFGISTHDHVELETALSCKPDYVSFGPVWATQLRGVPLSGRGLERLVEWRELCGNVPLVAIGGMTIPRMRDCFAAGADTVAAMSAFIAHEDPEGQVREWLKAVSTEAPTA
ncbi:thiamine phosphate synthase [Gluconobacter kanchanaburiensis]|uniref:Thiamine-phosphate synthase n=1 Tax=Gluconobacter kanchanaburiensis NBRC 103587 TaxID=1307948 RepID=A0A511B671_9PROT|nr:thiamine phosphate synthase [Gluconobacter kanchanaburiensis]MBF0861220.1 thiamine phosphate synthase [Gluconobacter kanchanaburiensis]GEK95960.1 thiamine-phosphate synthase [Gluconobacter kanchanaburiensis NBRC 103587]